MRLHIGGIRAKNLFGAVDGELLGHIDVFTAAVIAFAGIAFGVFVGELCALCLHHSRGGVVFTGDQLNMVLLAKVFCLNRCPEFGVGLRDQMLT